MNLIDCRQFDEFQMIENIQEEVIVIRILIITLNLLEEFFKRLALNSVD